MQVFTLAIEVIEEPVVVWCGIGGEDTITDGRSENNTFAMLGLQPEKGISK